MLEIYFVMLCSVYDSASTYTISSNIRERNLTAMPWNNEKWQELRTEFSASFDPILEGPSTNLNVTCTKMQCSFTATPTTLIHNNFSERLAALLYPGGAPRGQSASHCVLMTEVVSALYLRTFFFLHRAFYNTGFLLNLTRFGRVFPVWKRNLQHAICLQVLSSLINFSLIFLCYQTSLLLIKFMTII
jgi:hypothetical protein